jgi:hypothetical protein
MRGRSTCSSPFCRLQKLDFVARYTALYANKVLFPLPLSHPSKVDLIRQEHNSKIPKNKFVILLDEHVGRLNVSVDNAFIVELRHGIDQG